MTTKVYRLRNWSHDGLCEVEMLLTDEQHALLSRVFTALNESDSGGVDGPGLDIQDIQEVTDVGI